jgi:hypothetical protein
MNDPERILDRPPSELAARLLRAGSEEMPSKRSLQRALSAVGVGATALGAAGSAGALAAAKAATSVTLVALTKWAGAGALGGIMVAAAAHGLSTPAPRNSAHPPEPALQAPVRPAEVAVPRVDAPQAPTLAASAEPEPAPRKPAGVTLQPEREAPLAAEVEFVDRGRAAFQRGDSNGALAALASYERAFAEPRLLPEVLYLRMEALEQGGEHVRAAELARRILRSYARSPHAARARVVLGEP